MSCKLTDKAEILFRQIHPNFMAGDEPSADRFRPSERDENRLSVDRSSIFTPEESYTLYTKNGLKSAAVYGVSVEEFNAESIDCISDPVPAKNGREQNPAHALADYHKIQELKNQKNIAKKLKRLAVARGCLYSPSVGS